MPETWNLAGELFDGSISVEAVRTSLLILPDFKDNTLESAYSSHLEIGGALAACNSFLHVETEKVKIKSSFP